MRKTTRLQTPALAARLHAPALSARVLAAGAALLGMLLVAGTADAQRGGGGGRGMRGGMGPGRGAPNPDRMIEGRVARLGELLTLTEDQRARVKEILQQEHEQMEKLRPEQRRGAPPPDSATRAAHREQLEAIHKLTEEQIEAVLDPAQREQFAKVREARDVLGIGPGRGGRGRGHGPPPPRNFRRPPAE